MTYSLNMPLTSILVADPGDFWVLTKSLTWSHPMSLKTLSIMPL